MTPAGTKVIGYVRASTHKQDLGPEAQRAAIEQECKRRHWSLVSVLEDKGKSAATMSKRAQLELARTMLAGGVADALVVTKLDRLSRSLVDFATLTKEAKEAGWAIVVLDQGFDMTTPNGRAMAGMLAVFAEWEREMISERTKNALAVKKRQGVKLGRQSTLPVGVVQRIKRERARGASLNAIANGLNAEGVQTGQGGAQWYASTVRDVLHRSDMGVTSNSR